MATYNKYDTFIQNLADKLIDAYGTSDTWKIVIHTDATSLTTGNGVTNVTQIGGTNGYTTGGLDITFNSTRTGATLTATTADTVVWTASGAPLGNSTAGQYFSVYDDTSASDNLLCRFDYGAPFTVASGETMTVDFGASLFTMT